MELFSYLLLFGIVSQLVLGLSPADWRKQSIYQVMVDRFARTDGSTTAACNPSQQVYCGGTWQGLINKLSYIQGMGFTAIWISPITKQMDGDTSDGESYHGYWAQDITSLNSAFGTPADLKALSAALHSRGMYLMLDVVPNHFAYNGCGNCVNYSILTPFNSSSYFHNFCLIDNSNATSVRVCWEGDNIVSLPDLRTEDSDVRAIWYDWIASTVSTYGVDGLRVDSAQNVEQSFFPGFESAAGVYTMGEVFNGDPSYVGPYQQYMSGVLNYPAYFWITRAFQSSSGSMSDLVTGINSMKADAKNTSLLGSFSENHDLPRFPSLTSDIALDKNAIAFTMLMDGIPIIYQGQEQHYSGGSVPNDREAIWLSGYSTASTLYTWITALNAIRTRAIAQDPNYLLYQAYPSYTDSHTIVMRKGLAGAQTVGVFTNVGASGAAYSITLNSTVTGFVASQAVVDVLSCTAYTIDGNGNLAFSVVSGLPKVFYPSARLSGSGICSSTTTPVPTTVAITFDELVTTTFGTTVKIVGNTSSLGSWNTSNAIALDASQYTSSKPLWDVTLALPPGSAIQYKFIKVDSSGSVTWEADPNHTFTVPTAAATVSTSWQT